MSINTKAGQHALLQEIGTNLRGAKAAREQGNNGAADEKCSRLIPLMQQFRRISELEGPLALAEQHFARYCPDAEDPLDVAFDQMHGRRGLNGLNGTLAQHGQYFETLYLEALRTESMLRAALELRDFKGALHALRLLEELTAGAVREGIHAKAYARSADEWRDVQRLRDVCTTASEKLFAMRDTAPTLNGLSSLPEEHAVMAERDQQEGVLAFIKYGMKGLKAGECEYSFSDVLGAYQAFGAVQVHLASAGLPYDHDTAEQVHNLAATWRKKCLRKLR